MAIGDFTRVRENIGSLNAYNSNMSVGKQLSNIQLKLASGKDINVTADNPAGMTISTTLDARSRGMAVALNNVSTAKNVLSIAEGGLQNISDILIVLKEKITRAASDTMGPKERGATQVEMSLLIEEIDDIVQETSFAGTNLLDGTFVNKSFQTGERTTDTYIFTSLTDSSSTGLGVTAPETADLVFTASGSSTALANVDSAIQKVSDRLQKIGAVVSRLGAKEATLSVGVTNNKAAKSRIMDADMAKTQLDATRLQILQQTSGVAIGALNLSPQNVLALFQ